ncbi:MAG: TonB-dependent receptor [Verrucomicrobia bacterium]|nr:TonB-dependent receptor [Verrucomicrobiota bacterium]
MKREPLDTYQKAAQINQDKGRYGTFAEIGAGQEVARVFFRVGGAADTVAKTMSAYDMTFSDAIYGPSERYVSRQRLERMLDHEYELLLERLNDQRGSHTCFFVFANTVAARSFRRQDEAHGWLGVRFQTRPFAPPSQIIIHVRMLDEKNVLQQEALGIVGVNLLHAAFHLYQTPEELIGALLDDLTAQRIEVDMIKFTGPEFAAVDNRLMSLQLVQQGLTDTAMFTADGEAVQPGEVLWQKPILLERGSFRPVNLLNLDMLECASVRFLAEPQVQGTPVVVLMEMTLRNLLAAGAMDHQDFLARADLLGALGLPVLITNYSYFYPLAGCLGRYTKRRIGIAIGVPALREIFKEKYYADLEGGILESFGRLFKHDLTLYVYPYREPSGETIRADNLEIAPHLRHLYQHLLENGHLQFLENFNEACLSIRTADILSLIQRGEPAWEQMVPPKVAQMIKARKFFGCP